MTDNQEATNNEAQLNTTTDISFHYEEYGELELSLVPAFEFSSPISSISSTCSSPDRTTIQEHQRDDMNEDLDDEELSKKYHQNQARKIKNERGKKDEWDELGLSGWSGSMSANKDELPKKER